jgi:hypothetical protein
MVQTRSLKPASPGSGKALPLSSPRGAAVLSENDIQDLLGSITDRADLERLFDRRVGLPSILRLMGHQVSREQINELLEASDIESAIRKLV